VSGRRRFGAVRKLPSGRWQVRFRDPESDCCRTAAQTFTTKTEAGRWLSVLEADMTRALDGVRALVIEGACKIVFFGRDLVAAVGFGLI
jgi:hypothetical protein